MIRRLIALTLLFGMVAYLFLDKSHRLKEHLTPGPPTLLTLQTDTQDLDTRLTSLKSDFDKMNEKAKQGADASASARSQMSLLKNS
jgi:hypothetical protein